MSIVLLLFLAGAGFRRIPDKAFFDVDTCTHLRGIGAVFIMLIHLHMRWDFTGGLRLITPYNPASILANGMFFFISGYGLSESARSKQHYLTLKRYCVRILSITLPAYLSYLLFFPLIDQPAPAAFLKHFFLTNLISWFKLNDVTWFIIELCFLYTAFWLLYRFLPVKAANGALFLLSSIWTVAAFYWGRGLVWYASTFCFISGIVTGQYRDRLFSLFEKHSYYAEALIGTFTVFLSTFLIHRMPPPTLFPVVRDVVCTNIACVSFCLMIYTGLFHIRAGNRLTKRLGKYAFEIYLIHLLPITLFFRRGIDVWISVPATIVFSIMMALAVYHVSRFLFVKSRVLA